MSFSIDEFNYINVVAVSQLFFRAAKLILGAYELPEHFQPENVITWVILPVRKPSTILDNHDFLVFNFFLKVIGSQRIQ